MDPAVVSAMADWEDGVRRLREPGPLRGPREVVAGAVQDELRRRVGVTFTLADLARAYASASDWYLDLARRVAPLAPGAWDPAVALDGAFGDYARHASDGRRR
jgi:hypothetical protein